MSSNFFFFNDTATTEIYTLSLHDALPISRQRHVEADAQERPDEGGGAEKCRGPEHEPEIADAQAHEGGAPSPRRPDVERRVRADVTRGLDREVEPHAARRRVRPELADGERAG